MGLSENFTEDQLFFVYNTLDSFYLRLREYQDKDELLCTLDCCLVPLFTSSIDTLLNTYPQLTLAIIGQAGINLLREFMDLVHKECEYRLNSSESDQIEKVVMQLQKSIQVGISVHKASVGWGEQLGGLK